MCCSCCRAGSCTEVIGRSLPEVGALWAGLILSLGGLTGTVQGADSGKGATQNLPVPAEGARKKESGVSSPSYSPNHAPILSPTHSLTFSCTHLPTFSPTHPLTHSLIHSRLGQAGDPRVKRGTAEEQPDGQRPHVGCRLLLTEDLVETHTDEGQPAEKQAH